MNMMNEYTGPVFDMHCHIYPEKIARKAALNTG